MSNQSQTTTNTPSEPRRCKMGCGFFGSGATEDCCSKCWRGLQKKQGVDAPVQQPELVASPSQAPALESNNSDIAEEPTAEAADVTTEVISMDVDVVDERMIEETCCECTMTATTPKKKKKKASYKSMMAAMLQSSSPSRDVEQEKESLRKVTGGGTFSKIDKI